MMGAEEGLALMKTFLSGSGEGAAPGRFMYKPSRLLYRHVVAKFFRY